MSPSGHIRVLSGRPHAAVFISAALAGERVGFEEQDDGRWLISYTTIDLGCYDPVQERFVPADRPVKSDGRPNLSPMSPV